MFKRHYPELVRRLTVILGSREDAEDIAQETFIKLFRSESKINNIGGWLKTVGYRMSLNLIRGNENRKKREQGSMSFPLDESSENLAMRNIEVDLVRLALLDLSHRDRHCLVLKMSGFRYAEIARILGVREKSVGTIVSRAQQRFKNKYQLLNGRDPNCGMKNGSNPEQGRNVPELMKVAYSHTLTASCHPAAPGK